MKTGRKNNSGFTLAEIIVVISIFTILLGILVPSLNSLLGFRVQRATHSIGSALDKAKTEAMNRLVGEMALTRKDDGYYISYYLDRGKTDGTDKTLRVKQEQEEKIAPKNLSIQIQETDGILQEMEVNDSLILTYNREDGSFRPVQTTPLTQEQINEFLDKKTDVEFFDKNSGVSPSGEPNDIYCEKIVISGGFRKRTITLNQGTGSYSITVG